MRRVWLFAAVVFVGFAIAAAMVWCHLAATPHLVEADERTAQQWVKAALPLGSTRKQVAAWLASKWIGVDHRDDARGRFLAARRDYLNWRGESGDLWMEFTFDEQGRLARINVYIELVSL